MRRANWSIPVVLTVQALALGCPDREEHADTVASSESTGGPVDCAALMQQAECDANPRCSYSPDFGGCVIDCATLDESDCNAVDHCLWSGTQCDFAPIA